MICLDITLINQNSSTFYILKVALRKIVRLLPKMKEDQDKNRKDPGCD